MNWPSEWKALPINKIWPIEIEQESCSERKSWMILAIFHCVSTPLLYGCCCSSYKSVWGCFVQGVKWSLPLEYPDAWWTRGQKSFYLTGWSNFSPPPCRHKNLKIFYLLTSNWPIDMNLINQNFFKRLMWSNFWTAVQKSQNTRVVI